MKMRNSQVQRGVVFQQMSNGGVATIILQVGDCCVWSMIVQRSLFQLDVYPRKSCTPLHAGGGAGGTCRPRKGLGASGPPEGLVGSAPEAKNNCKIAF